MAVLYIYVPAKDVLPTFFSSKTERFHFKSGCVVLVVKCLKENQFIVLR